MPHQEGALCKDFKDAINILGVKFLNNEVSSQFPSHYRQWKCLLSTCNKTLSLTHWSESKHRAGKQKPYFLTIPTTSSLSHSHLCCHSHLPGEGFPSIRGSSSALSCKPNRREDLRLRLRASAYPGACEKWKSLGPPETYWIRTSAGGPQQCVLTSLPGDSDAPPQVWKPCPIWLKLYLRVNFYYALNHGSS